jgi:hypothetical protein
LIFDWKTSQHTPKRSWLNERLQTRVYPFLLATLAAQPNSGFSLLPDQIEMRYWYPAFPDISIEFTYSSAQFEEDHQVLKTTIQEILRLDEAGFTKTENEALCKYCQYRSLCNRGVSAGDHTESDELQEDPASAFDFDFDQLSPAD